LRRKRGPQKEAGGGAVRHIITRGLRLANGYVSDRGLRRAFASYSYNRGCIRENADGRKVRGQRLWCGHELSKRVLNQAGAKKGHLGQEEQQKTRSEFPEKAGETDKQFDGQKNLLQGRGKSRRARNRGTGGRGTPQQKSTSRKKNSPLA